MAMEKSSLLLLNDIRVRNTLAILRALLNHNGYSRVELAKVVGCDNTAVTRAIQDLMSRGLVKSAGKTEAAHGRPREKLVLSDQGALKRACLPQEVRIHLGLLQVRLSREYYDLHQRP